MTRIKIKPEDVTVGDCVVDPPLGEVTHAFPRTVYVGGDGWFIMRDRITAAERNPEPGPCGDPECYVLHGDPANPIHPPWYVAPTPAVEPRP